MSNLYFLLGEKKPYSTGEDLLINILDRLSLFQTAYKIDYCYNFSPSTKKKERATIRYKRLNELIDYSNFNPETIFVAMGWMATEVLTDISKTRMSLISGCRFTIKSFKYDVWFTYDPTAALFDPNLYVDIMGCVSAAIRSSGRPIVINKSVKPFKWPGI